MSKAVLEVRAVGKTYGNAINETGLDRGARRFISKLENLFSFELQDEKLDKYPVMRAVTVSARKKHLKDYLQKLIGIRNEGDFDETDEYGNPNLFVCSACLQRFFTYDELLEHISRPTGHLLFRCQICYEMFETLNLCQAVFHGPDFHINEAGYYPKKIPIELIEACPPGEILTLNEVCPECRQGVGSLIAHLWSSKPEDSTLHCPYCNTFITRNPCRYNLHIRIHRNTTAPFRCPDCAKVIKSTAELFIHLNDVCRHLEQSIRYKCSICGLVFRTNDDLQRHTFSDHNSVKYKCHLCPAEFSIASEKNTHYDECHPEELTPSALRRTKAYIISHKCAVCGEDDLKGFSYERHMRKHLTLSNISFVLFTCKCGFITMFKGTYLKHKSTPCLTLDFAALNESSARLKMCTHCSDLKFYNGSEPFICESCETSEDSEVLLIYKCSLCSKDIKYSMEFVILHFQIEHKLMKLEIPYKFVKKIPMNNGNSAVEEDSKEDLSSKIIKDETKEGIVGMKSSVEDAVCEMEEKTLEDSTCTMKEESKALLDLTIKAETMECTNHTLDEKSRDTVSDRQHKCSKCSSSFDEKDDLRSHYISTHRENSGDFHCLECGDAFRTVKSLSIHLQSHGIKDAVSYINKYDVSSEIHPHSYSVRDESGSDELICPVCKLKFNNPAQHLQHLRSHGMAFLQRIKHL